MLPDKDVSIHSDGVDGKLINTRQRWLSAWWRHSFLLFYYTTHLQQRSHLITMGRWWRSSAESRRLSISLRPRGQDDVCVGKGPIKSETGKTFVFGVCPWSSSSVFFWLLLYPIVNIPATDILLSCAFRNNNRCSYVHPHHVQVLWFRLLFFVETQKEIEWVNEDAIKTTKEQQR